VTGRVVVALAVAVVVLAGPALSSVAVGQEAVSDATVAGEPTVGAHSLSDHANNTTVHEDPEQVDQSSDIASVRRWLEGRMGERLEDSTVQLEQGEYERARSAIGDDYRDLLGKYVDVEGETEGDGAGDQFEETQEQQQEFVDQIQEYRETREEYEEAKENGNEQRARELARELERQAENVTETGRNLQTEFDELGNRTSVDTDREQAAVENVTENVSSQQEEIRAETFVQTRLAVEAVTERASFLEPIEVTGRLIAVNGTPLRNRTVSLRVGDERVSTTTGENGSFTVQFRPTTLPLGEQPVSVRYRPESTSPFFGSNQSAVVEVEQVDPTLAVTGFDSAVRFGDSLSVNGSVSVEDIAAQSVPVAVYLGGEKIGTTVTDADGQFRFEGVVPAGVEDGDRRLRVVLPLEDQALSSTSRQRTVAVEESETQLSVSVEQAGGGSEVAVDGRLQTATGEAVPGQPVRISVDGTTLGIVRTGSDGSLSGTLEVPGSIRPEEGNVTLQVVALFEGSGTNLAPSRRDTSLRLTVVDGGSEGDRSQQDRTTQIVASVLAAIVVLGLLFVAWRRFWREPADSPPTPVEPHTAQGEKSAHSENSITGLQQAEQALEDRQYDVAVELAYERFRERSANVVGIGDAATHWEFLGALYDSTSEVNMIDDAERLTELYEQASFAPDGVPSDDARWAVRQIGDKGGNP
jgi:hypothetical protein